MACGKRPLPAGSVDRIAEDIAAEIYRLGANEITSAAIGDMVMARLKRLDHIAYLRYASVYREFEDITALKEEIDTLSGAVTIHPVDQLRLIPEDKPDGLPWSHRRERP
jgi:transcriptional repressor NrdR